MKQQLIQLLETVGPKHISRSSKVNKSIFNYIEEKTKHIPTKNYSQKIYIVLNDLDDNPTCYCGKDLKFESIVKGFSEYCSVKCARNSPKTKESFDSKIKSRTNEDKQKIIEKRQNTTKEKYGVDNISQLSEIKEKKSETLQENYGVSSPLQSSKIMEKSKATNQERYGRTTYLSSDTAKNRIKETNQEKYGVNNPMQNTTISQKTQETQNKKYGGIGFQVDKGQYEKVDWVETRAKAQQTNLLKYGFKNPLKNDEVTAKAQQTNLLKYGFKNPLKNDEVKAKAQQTKQFNYITKLAEQIKDYYTPKFDLNTYIGQNNVYKWEHNKCGHKFEHSHTGNNPLPICRECYPKLNTGISQEETELYDFIIATDKEQSNQTILSGRKEIDIYIPSKKIAIEYNGIFWHSVGAGKDKDYHLNKMIECNNKGIELIQIFSSEWLFQKEQVKDYISKKLNNITTYINGYTIQIITNKLASKFYKENSLIPKQTSNREYGIFVNNQLKGVYNYREIDHKIENFQITTILGEDLRKADKDKIFKSIQHIRKPIIIQEDNRLPLIYRPLMKTKSLIAPTYHYFDNSKGKKTKLLTQGFTHKEWMKREDYKATLTLWENIQLQGYNRIYDCGKTTYVL